MKLLFAPMATLSHEALRRMIDRFGGCDEYYTEMIQASSLVAGGKFEPYYVRTGPAPEKIVWQLTDSKPEALAKAAAIVCDLGGIGIDINMGCCAPEICRHGAGIAWMCKPVAETAAMLSKVKSAMDNAPGNGGNTCRRLSVKMRLGDENFTDRSLFAFADMLVGEGVTHITLHPRTKKERFRRTARWEYVEKLARYISGTYGSGITVGGNGDITTPEKAADAARRCPSAASIMIGRAAVQKPWIFAQAARLCNAAPEQAPAGTECPASAPATPHTIDMFGLAARFLSDLQECQPAEFQHTRAQRFFAYYCDNFTFAHYIKTRILNSNTHTEMLQQLSAYFEKESGDRFHTVIY